MVLEIHESSSYISYICWEEKINPFQELKEVLKEQKFISNIFTPLFIPPLCFHVLLVEEYRNSAKNRLHQQSRTKYLEIE